MIDKIIYKKSDNEIGDSKKGILFVDPPSNSHILRLFESIDEPVYYINSRMNNSMFCYLDKTIPWYMNFHKVNSIDEVLNDVHTVIFVEYSRLVDKVKRLGINCIGLNEDNTSIVSRDLSLHEDKGIRIDCNCFFDGKKFLDKHLLIVDCENTGKLCSWTNESIYTKRYFGPLTRFFKSIDFHGALKIKSISDGRQLNIKNTTANFPVSESEIWSMSINNYGKFLRGLASGIIDEFEVKNKYHVIIDKRFCKLDESIEIGYDIEKTQERVIKSKLKGEILFINSNVTDKCMTIPNKDFIMCNIGGGNILIEAIENAFKLSEELKVINESKDINEVIKVFEDKLIELEKLNIEF